MKLTAQMEGKPALRNVAKLLMNSMFGRFGMNTDNTQAKVVRTDQALEITRKYLVTNLISLGGLELIVYIINAPISFSQRGGGGWRNSPLQLPGQTNVPLAAAITSYSRIILNTYKLLALSLGLTIYYSDTDSLVLSGPLPTEYIDPTQLGSLKLEHTIKEGYFVAPKVYWMETEEGLVSKCKGYSGTLNKSQVQTLYEGETLNLPITRWCRSLKTGQIQILKGIPYYLKAQLNKRTKVYQNGVWVNTKPPQPSPLISRGVPYSLSAPFNKRVKEFDPTGVWVNTRPLVFNKSQPLS